MERSAKHKKTIGPSSKPIPKVISFQDPLLEPQRYRPQADRILSGDPAQAATNLFQFVAVRRFLELCLRSAARLYTLCELVDTAPSRSEALGPILAPSGHSADRVARSAPAEKRTYIISCARCQGWTEPIFFRSSAALTRACGIVPSVSSRRRWDWSVPGSASRDHIVPIEARP